MTGPGRGILTGRCDTRNRHVLYLVIETPDELVIHAPLYAAGRERDTWRPDRRQLDPLNGRGRRYGCQCRRSALVMDADLFTAIRRGETCRVESVYNISER